MAMEYLYFDHNTEQPVPLKHFKNLMYEYEEWSGDEGHVEIIDRHDNYEASFQVKHRTCYLLQRRNQSALQLHEVTPPRILRERAPWLFGFGSKQRYDSRNSFSQACLEYCVAHPSVELTVRRTSCNGSYLEYAFAIDERMIGSGCATVPVAYWRQWNDDTAWAFFGDDTICEFIAEMYRDLDFKYPLQYVIELVKGMATTYPVPTRGFFQEKLGIYDKNAYYASEYGGF